MSGIPEPSSLLTLVSPPWSPAASPSGSDTRAYTHLKDLLAAAEDAGLPPTSLLLSALARRDRTLAARARRTAEWARLIATALGRNDLAQDAHDVALLADVGQLAVDTPAESPWLEWQRRRASHDLVQAIPLVAHLAPAVLAVRERFDGDGLPLGLRGEEIPLTARIARLVRDFDLASQGWWPGQPAAAGVRACSTLVSLAGQTLDPALVRAWLAVVDREVAADVA